MTTATVVLARGRERSARQGHPWIFSGAVARVEGADDSPLARVISAEGETLGVGFYSAGSRIRVRLVRADDGPVDRDLFRERIAEALALRRRVVPPATTGYRLLNAEGDFLPGWTVDRFGDTLVSQITSAGLERCAPRPTPPCASWSRTPRSCSATAAACGAARGCRRKTS